MALPLIDRILDSLSADALRYFFPGFVRKEVTEDCAISFKAIEGTKFYLPDDLGGPFLSTYMERESDPYLEAELEPIQTEAELDPDARTKALLEEIESIQRKYGVTIEELEAILSYKVKLSRLRITRRHAIVLEDFDQQEVRMDTLTKAVFLLFLKHPEGIRYKDLVDHRQELEHIYMSITGRSDLEAIRKSISDLTDPIMSNSINEKVSKAKKAFRNVVDERVARFYYIDGKQGAAKSIALDRSLIIWE